MLPRKTKKEKNTISIKETIIRSFGLAILTIIFIIFIGAWHINKKNLEIVRENDLKKEHAVLLNFLMPALSVEDTMDIRRLLHLSSSQNKIFTVIDNNGNILLPDYEKLPLIEALKKSNFLNNCKKAYSAYQKIQGKKYWIHCSPMKNKNLVYSKRNFGTLISFSNLSIFYFSSMFVHFLSVAIISLLITLLWFHSILNKKLLKPLITLKQNIVNQANEPFSSSDHLSKLEKNIPKEILAINNAFEKVLMRLKEEYQKRADFEKRIMILDLAANVAHDIRSPLASMTALLKDIAPKISNKKYQILEQSIQSVRDIANNLLTQYKNSENNSPPIKEDIDDSNKKRYILLPSLIDLALSQKRYEWQENPCDIHVFIQKEATITWLFVSPNEIRRLLSNLLNNAYEALEDKREIFLECSINDSKLILHIKDTGKGIAEDKINAVLSGLSLKKTSGNGLGLSGAKKIMKALNGDLFLFSKRNQGTTITLLFPIIERPSWFPESIILNSNKPILFLDDESSMHKFWINYAHPIRLIHCTTIDEVLAWIEKNPEKRTEMLLLSDHALRKESSTGLELLEKLNLQHRSYLITSHAEEVTIQQRCAQANIYLIHKSVLTEIPIIKKLS